MKTSPTDIFYENLGRLVREDLKINAYRPSGRAVRPNDLIVSLEHPDHSVTKLPLIRSKQYFIENYPTSQAPQQGYMKLTYLMTAFWLQQIKAVLVSDESHNLENMRGFWDKLVAEGLATQANGHYTLTLPEDTRRITVADRLPDVGILEKI